MKKPKRTDLTLGERIPFGIAGLFGLPYGYSQSVRGNAIYTTWRGLGMTAEFAMVFGAILLGIAIFPWGRLHFLWDDGSKKHKR